MNARQRVIRKMRSHSSLFYVFSAPYKLFQLCSHVSLALKKKKKLYVVNGTQTILAQAQWARFTAIPIQHRRRLQDRMREHNPSVNASVRKSRSGHVYDVHDLHRFKNKLTREIVRGFRLFCTLKTTCASAAPWCTPRTRSLAT